MSRGISDKITYKPYNRERAVAPAAKPWRVVFSEPFCENSQQDSAVRTLCGSQPSWSRTSWQSAHSEARSWKIRQKKYSYRQWSSWTGKILPVRSKYTSYEKEIKRSLKKNSFSFENWMYDAEQKKYTCPCGNPVPYKKTVTKKNSPGYPQTYKAYQCDNCEGCQLRELCTKSEYGRLF